MKGLRNIARVFFIAWIVVFYSGWAAAENSAKVQLRLGADESGSYYQFAQDLIDLQQQHPISGVEIAYTVTQGSVDNLQRIKARSLDVAVVQNDIAYYTYNGKHGYETFQGFATAVPLFPEYVQVIVRKDSDIRILGDLRNRVIALGPLKSGSMRNGLDLLREIGLRPDVDYRARHMPTTDSVRDLLSGKIDVMIYTGAALPMVSSNAWKLIRVLPIPSEIIGELRSRFTYYRKGEFTSPANSDMKSIPTLTVTAYLVMGSHVSEASARAVTEALLLAWPDLSARRDHYQLVPLSDALRRQPVPLHPGAEAAFHDAGLIETSLTEYVVSLVAGLLVFLVLWARGQCRRYDRLGNVRAVDSWYYRSVLWVNRSGVFFLIIAGLFIAVIGIVETIQYFEAEHAREMNVDNEFAAIDFWDAMLWMFMFMGSGHSGNIFPLSTVGKALAALVPFLGISTLFGFFWAGVDKYSEASAARKRGTLIKDVKDHVLVCGWNEKVPGLIFALTSADAPEKIPVVVVADIEGGMPLEQYKFNPKYVSYFRGDSSDHKALENAHIKNASAAVVVAGIRKRKGRNIRSVLSVMALKEAHRAKTAGKQAPRNEHLFVAAEILFEDNKELFDVCQADALVHSDTIANRLAAQCCISEHVVDFVLDMLTYDKYAELNSVSASQLDSAGLADGLSGFTKPREWRQAVGVLMAWLSKRWRGESKVLVGRKLGEIRTLLASEGINVVGMVATKRNRAGLVDHRFDDSTTYRMLLSEEDEASDFTNDHSLLFISDNQSVIYTAGWQIAAGKVGEAVATIRPSNVIPMPENTKVLLVGDYARCRKVSDILQSVPWVQVLILTDNKEAAEQDRTVIVVDEYSSEKAWEDTRLIHVDVVVILNKAAQAANETNLTQDQGEIDARVILAAKFARQHFMKSNPEREGKVLKIVAEMLGRDNEGLFHDAGVDVVIPSNLLVERMLTKIVYTRGQVSEFLMALMALDDEVHFLTQCLTNEKHGHLLGKTFQQLMQEMPSGFQFLGVLPADTNNREMLENKQKDFSYHFLASPRLADKIDYRSQEGDEIALIVDQKEWSVASSD